MNRTAGRLVSAALWVLIHAGTAVALEPRLFRGAFTASRGIGCEAARSLQLCPTGPLPGRPRLSVPARPRRADQDYNRLQRLAGAIADRMDAGSIGSLRVKLKIILE